MEVKLDKAQHDLTRLQTVVVKKQAGLHQAEERADSKAKELRELHAEMLAVKKEVIQVVPPLAPPSTPPPVPTIVPLEEMVVKMVTSPPRPETMSVFRSAPWCL